MLYILSNTINIHLIRDTKHSSAKPDNLCTTTTKYPHEFSVTKETVASSCVFTRPVNWLLIICMLTNTRTQLCNHTESSSHPAFRSHTHTALSTGMFCVDWMVFDGGSLAFGRRNGGRCSADGHLCVTREASGHRSDAKAHSPEPANCAAHPHIQHTASLRERQWRASVSAATQLIR